MIAIGFTGSIDLLVSTFIGKHGGDPGIDLLGLVVVLGVFVLSDRFESAFDLQV